MVYLKLYSKSDITDLYVYGVSSIDLSKLTKLQRLYISSAGLSGLNLQNNGELLTLDCSNSNLDKLDVSKNVKLKTLNCSSNPLTELNVTKNTALETLDFSSSRLQSIDLSKNTKLKTLDCSCCQMKSLDISHNPKLQSIDASCNKLPSLDLSKNDDIVEVKVNDNNFKNFDDLKVNPNAKKEKLVVLADYPRLELPETMKAGEVVDLSKYAKCGDTKSTYDIWYYEEDDSGKTGAVLPETDKDFKFVFGNAYAGKRIVINLYNSGSYIRCILGDQDLVKNPDAPAAPGKAKGDVPVDDISGTISAAETTKDFDAQEVVFSDKEKKYVLGEKLKKEDLKLDIAKLPNEESLYDAIAKADKTFKKDSARLLGYNITLSHGECTLIKLKDGINLTIKYPSDMAKDWNKYNYKVYHFAQFDYDKLESLEEPKIESVKCTADKNGIHFKAPSFSNYVISVTPKSAGSPSPKTGESNIAPNIAVLLVLLAASGMAGVMVKRKGELVVETAEID